MDNSLQRINKGLVALHTVIKLALGDEGQSSTHKYAEFYSCALRVMDEMNFDIKVNLKTVELPLDALKIAYPPADYVNWTKIGIWDKQLDQILHISQNDEIPLNRTEISQAVDLSGLGLGTLPLYVDYAIYNNHVNADGEIIGGLFGYGYQDNLTGYFRYDEQNRRFCFDSSFKSKTVYLEYASSDYSGCDNKTHVDVRAREMIIAGIFHYYYRRKKNVSLGEKQKYEYDYEKEKDICRSRFSDFSIQDAIDVRRKNFKLSPKS